MADHRPSRRDATINGYVGLVAGATLVVFGGSLAASGSGMRLLGGWQTAVLAAALAAAAVLAQRFPLHLTYQTKVYVDTAVFTAAGLVLDVPTAMLVAAVPTAINQARLREGWAAAIFNAAQTALYVGAGAAVFRWLEGNPVPPVLPGLGNLWAVLACAATMHLVNTLVVAVVGALQVGVSPLRCWRTGIWLDLPEHVALVVFGVLIAVVSVDRPWALPVFAIPIAVVYASLRRQIQLRAATQAAIEGLADTVDLRDPDQVGHSERVAGHARRLAERLGIGPYEAERIAAAARVHDVGKVGMNPSIVLKPGRLATADWDEVRRHPVVGAELVGQFPSYALGAAYVRHHHERWDGGGYPEGLAGEAIPLGARVIAVADAFDALTSPRPYRPALGVGMALHELERGAAHQWDPEVVATMVALVREDLARDVPDGGRLPGALARPETRDGLVAVPPPAFGAGGG